MDVRSIPLEELLPPLYPVRRVADDEKMAELVRSIQVNGLLHPLVVIPEDGAYRILAGHRRFIAVSGIGWEEVPCNVLELDRRKAEDVTREETLVREDVNALDLGYFLKHVCDREGISGAQVASRYGHGPSWATRYIRLTKLDDDTQEAVQAGVLEGRVALELQRVDNEELRKAYTQEAIVREHSISDVRQVADAYQRNKQGIDQGIERATAVREEIRLGQKAPVCFGCGRSIEEAPSVLHWLCAFCIRAIGEAQEREAVASE